jgi:hypothetical protein
VIANPGLPDNLDILYGRTTAAIKTLVEELRGRPRHYATGWNKQLKPYR